MSNKPLFLSVIIPLFNEEKTIHNVLRGLQKLKLSDIRIEIIVVDDGSTDASSEKLKAIKDKKVKVITHKANMGKGVAVRTGVKHAKGTYILIQDADLEYNPGQIKTLLAPILKENAQVVFGTRIRRLPNFKKDERTLRFFAHYLGNRLLSLITSLLYGQWITDMETGYKVIPKKVFNQITLRAKGFELEPEVTAKLLKKRYHIVEVAISTTPRGYDEGKKLRTIPDGVKALWTIIKYRFTD